MKRKLIVSLLAVAVAISSSPLPAACRVQRAGNVQHHRAETKIAVLFVVPVAVPVAVISPYFYGYSQFAPNALQNPLPLGEGRVRVSDAALQHPHPNPLPEGEGVGEHRRAISLIATHCATCHGGASPQGQLSLERVDKLTLADRLAAIRAVLTRRMPKGEQLDDEQMRAIVEELAAYE